MKNKKQQIWRKNFSIRNTHYQMGTASIADFMSCQPKPFEGIIKECVWIQQGEDNIASYFLVSELREMVRRTIFLIQNQPRVIEKIHRETYSYIRGYFGYSREVLKMDLGCYNNKELATIYERLLYFQKIHHAWAISTTWFVDADGEDLSKLLLSRATAIASGSSYRGVDVFSVLTTPDKPSLVIKEELCAWKIIRKIQADRLALSVFRGHSVADIEAGLKKLSPTLRQIIMNHFRKWRWQPFAYSGPAYDLDYYLSLWSGWIKEKINPVSRIKELEEYSIRVKQKKAKIYKDLKMISADRKIFQIASDIIYLKACRKDAVFFGMYVLDRILREVAVRLHLSLSQVRALAYWELPVALCKGYFSAEVLNARRKFSVYHQKGKVGKIYIGATAKKFLRGLKIEKEVINKTSTILGTVACPGRAKGKVKIVNLPEEMGKMNQGDVMVAHTTFPSLVPAMKKAAVIITDDGGITCHAAIVSRELKTPCVVGTKIATKILHDGDLVEVDADKGIVKIIKRK